MTNHSADEALLKKTDRNRLGQMGYPYDAQKIHSNFTIDLVDLLGTSMLFWTPTDTEQSRRC